MPDSYDDHRLAGGVPERAFAAANLHRVLCYLLALHTSPMSERTEIELHLLEDQHSMVVGD